MIVVNNIEIFMTILYFLDYTYRLIVVLVLHMRNSVCFRPWTISVNIGLDMLPPDAFMSCLYSTGEFQALQLIVLAALGAMD